MWYLWIMFHEWSLKNLFPSSLYFSSVAQLCPILCNAMDCSKPSFPVLHYLLEFVQTHVHWVDDVIEPSHPFSHPFPPALNLAQRQGLFQLLTSGGQSIGVWASASVHPMNIQGSFLLDWLVWSCLIPLIRGLSKVFSSTTIQNHQFFDAQTSLWSNFYICTWLLGKNHSFDYTDLCGQNDVSAF